MGIIQVMSQALANEIAAGEVVERPASCVKELVENSVDAKARHVRVAIEEGGIRRISVQDDGCGMDMTDAVLCFSRHATSKVMHSRDLFRIGTLGFRGEALAAISAVSQVVLRTRRSGTEAGVEIAVTGSERTDEPRPTGMPPGTEVTVTELFYNTPARLKYLRSVATEQARCHDVVQRAAIACPEISFRLEVDGRQVFQSLGSGRHRDACAAVFGSAEAGKMLDFAGDTSDYRVRGLIGLPLQAKSSRAFGHVVLNNRPIRNPALHQAVVSAYGERLMVRRHPLYVLSVTMDPTLVDINIHPHKTEVRFSEERDLTRLVQQVIVQTLRRSFLVPEIRSQRETDSVPTQLPFDLAPRQRDLLPTSDRRPAIDLWQPSVREPSAAFAAKSWETVLAPAPAGTGGGTGGGTGETSREQTVGMADELASETCTPLRSDQTASVRAPLAHLRPVGQALGMYIIADDGESLFIIDQHAAHERILYERFTTDMAAADGRHLELLTALALRLDPDVHAAAQALAANLADLGLAIEPFGGTDVLIRSVPAIWEGLDYAALTEQLLSSLTSVAPAVSTTSALRERIVTQSCKAAVKANQRMSAPEMAALCGALATLDDPFHCPHGRPVLIRWSNNHLEREFRRLV